MMINKLPVDKPPPKGLFSNKKVKKIKLVTVSLGCVWLLRNSGKGGKMYLNMCKQYPTSTGMKHFPFSLSITS